MKSIVKYGMALLALLAPITFQSCHDDKDIVVITEDLPLKVDHLYMVAMLPLQAGALTIHTR